MSPNRQSLILATQALEAMMATMPTLAVPQPIATTARATPNRTRSGMIPAPYDASALRTAGSGLVVVGIFGACHTGVPDAIIDFKALVIHVCWFLSLYLSTQPSIKNETKSRRRQWNLVYFGLCALTSISTLISSPPNCCTPTAVQQGW